MSSAVQRALPHEAPILLLAPASPTKLPRLRSIDAVRGTAMLFVFLAHFTAVYLWQVGELDLASDLTLVSMIASPTFVLVSGLMIGLFAATSPTSFYSLRIKLLDRGLFLLIVGHLLLALTVLGTNDNFAQSYRNSFITDAIAISIAIGPWLIGVLNARKRLAAAAVIFFLNWYAIIEWHPAAHALVLAKLYLVGTVGTATAEAPPFFAVIPWFAVYLAATALGERVGRMYARGERRRANRMLARLGAACFVLGSAVEGAILFLRRAHLSPATSDWSLLKSFSIYQKFPPGPVYLAFFGGAGIMLLGLMLELDRLEKFQSMMGALGRIGRASLFAFIAEYAFYVAFLERLQLSYTPLWPLMFVGSVVVLAAGAAAWDRYNGNRFLTVGVTSLLRRNVGAVRPAGLTQAT
jgi:uncharacterized membrane protein